MTGKKPKRVFDFYPLEDRILLSGEGLDVADVAPDPDISAALMAELADAEGHVLEDPAVAAALNPTVMQALDENADETGDLADAPTFDPALPLEVVFVDSSVEDAESLLDGLRGDVEDQTQWLVVELSADEDGIEQITRTLAELSGVDAVHILSHGDGLGIQLGNARLDVDTAENYAGDVACWANSLDADADLLIYGCDLASTDEGRELIESIATLCDCDVAASGNATGHELLGGDWELEYGVGLIETDVAFSLDVQQSWSHLMAVETVRDTFSAVSYSNNNGSVNWSGAWVETDAGGGGASAGGISIPSSYLSLQATSVGDGILREANLAGASTATLMFDMQNGLAASDVVRLEVSANGGSTWNTLKDYNASNFGILAESFDITAYAAPNTQIRFRYTTALGDAAVLVDNLQIAYDNTPPTATITVNTTSDELSGDADTSSLAALIATPGSDGVISLREAITAANATANGATADQIQFNIAGAGPHVINVASALPSVTDEVLIDGWSELDFSGTPVIRIDGNATAGSVDGLAFSNTSDGSTVRG